MLNMQTTHTSLNLNKGDNNMKFIKNIYIDLWKSEYDIYLIDDEYYLVANNKTIFDIFSKEKFQELGNHLVYPLCWLINHHITPKDVEDIICYNNVLCYVVKTENRNYYRMLPAIGGSGMAIDNAYISIGKLKNVLSFKVKFNLSYWNT